MMMLRSLPRSASLSRVASLPRAASLGVPAARRLCMHDDFKPKVRSYAADGEEASVHAQIEKDVAANKVVVFMKGVPDQPQCGFSNTVVQILKAEGTSFKGFNVLADPDLREGIKSYSNWPTIPQVYIDGEFIGGCDTTMEMCAPAKFRRNSERRRNFSAQFSDAPPAPPRRYKSGELRTMLQEAGAVAKE